jgi:multimeric flavodoxin WrbA
MKVLLLNGSPRTEGNTNLALNEISKQLEKNGIETQIMQIGTKSVRGCIACGRCAELGRCVFDDDLCNRVAEKMALCDALVVGSPVYWGQPNGTLLSLIQRMLYSQGNVVANKPVAAVCVCRRGGSTMAAQTLLMPFHLLNCPIVTSQYWPVVFGRAEGEAALDGEGMQTMRTLADNMAFLLKKIHADGEPQYPQREEHVYTHFIR